MHTYPTRADARMVLASLAATALLAACGNNEDSGVARGAIVSERTVSTVTRAALDASTAASGVQLLSGTAKCDVSVRQITYATPGPTGDSGVTASTAVLVPVASATCAGPFPIVSYNKGTDVIKARTMANAADGETGLLMAFFASQGYVVVAPDYLGYAESNLSFHPYLHVSSQASSTVDAIRAARTSLLATNTPLSSKLFVTGYSQGGHAAMSTHRALEADPAFGLTVTAAGPMSGPYDLSGSFVAGLNFLPSGTGGSTVFTPMVVTGFQRIYGNLYTTPTDYYKAPYVTGIESLLPGATPFNDLYTTGKLPLNLSDLLTPRAIADVSTLSSGLRRALDQNSLLGWKPAAPVLLCAGSRDPVVLYQVNTARSAADIASRGGSVTAVDVETVPAFAAALPPANATATQLAAYHGTTVPPLCMKVVRDNLFAALR